MDLIENRAERPIERLHLFLFQSQELFCLCDFPELCLVSLNSYCDFVDGLARVEREIILI